MSTYSLLLSNLKEKESFLSWCIIVISTLSSSLALIQLDDTEYETYSIYLKGSLSFFTIITTLCASWIKKNNYIERINIMDRYIQKLYRYIMQLENILSQSPRERILYKEYVDNYLSPIIDLLSGNPPASPIEHKRAVYILTKYYPELLNNLYPWGKKSDGDLIIYTFGEEVNLTYKMIKYKSFFHKIIYFYYCKCICCKKKYKNKLMEGDTQSLIAYI